MRVLLAVVLALALWSFCPPTLTAQEANPVVQAVTAGMVCKQNEGSRELDCEYRVGRDLYFTIAGVGASDAGITFMKVNYDGDYYATVGVLHGCVIVKQGKRTPETLQLPQFAFVSPRTGKVYSTWGECGQAH